MSTTGDPIVVGIDGSAGADAAIAWAADAAQRRLAPLRLVHAMIEITRETGRWRDLKPPIEVQRDQSWSLLTSAIVDLEDFDVQVEPVLAVGSPAGVLLDQARDAQLVVVGSRGLGDFAALLLGSTSLQVAMHAPCPVVVVRHRPTDTEVGPSAGRVVVGVDGSEVSEAAVAFAFEEADRRRIGLTAVHAWTSPLQGTFPSRPWTETWEEEDDERALLSERLAGWCEKFPDVDVVKRVDRGNAVFRLVAESNGAELTVVGSHGAGGFRGLILGSVSHGVLHHAGSPVAVVRAPRHSP